MRKPSTWRVLRRFATIVSGGALVALLMAGAVTLILLGLGRAFAWLDDRYEHFGMWFALALFGGVLVWLVAAVAIYLIRGARDLWWECYHTEDDRSVPGGR